MYNDIESTLSDHTALRDQLTEARNASSTITNVANTLLHAPNNALLNDFAQKMKEMMDEQAREHSLH